MSVADRLAAVVTGHSKLTILLGVAFVVAAAAGVGMLESTTGGAVDAEPRAQQTLEYVQDNYGQRRENVTVVAAYVRDRDGDVLSKSSLRASLRLQRRVLENDSVGPAVRERGRVVGVARIVTTRLTGDPRATTDERIAALNATSEARLDAVLNATLSADSPALRLMPNDYEPGTPTADGRRTAFLVADGALTDASPAPSAEEPLGYVVFHSLPSRADETHFTLAGPAGDDLATRINTDSLELILPVTLLLVFLAMVVAYRDVVDIVVGVSGVLASVVVAVGLMGWAGLAFGTTAIVVPILIVGLSIDFSFHVFMRYRERRAPGDDHAPPMYTSLSNVTAALALVTLTTAVGFASSVVSPLPDVRNVTLGMAVGIVGAFLVFVTLVPALKLELDRLRARLGFDANATPFGDAGRLRSVLSLGVSAARVSVALVVVAAVVFGGAGLFAWTELDRSLQSDTSPPADWSQELPEPFRVGEYDTLRQTKYVRSAYLAADPDSSPSQILVRGNVTSADTLHRLDRARRAAADSSVAFRRAGGRAETTGPLTEMRRLADENETFRRVFTAADTDGDGTPERNVTGVYDAFYRVAPGTAADVIERRDGAYRSLRTVVQTERGGDAVVVDDTLTAAMEPLAETPGVTVDVTGSQSVEAGFVRTAVDSVFRTVLLSLAGILLLLIVVYRSLEGSATLGVVTFLPVALVVAAISLGMLLLDVPITFVTALMIGLVIGMGVDYTIHVTDRFVDELDETGEPFAALERTVTGTGGALLGSSITTVAAFVTLAASPFEQTANFGSVIALAILGAFLVSVFVLPSLLVVWSERVAGVEASP